MHIELQMVYLSNQDTFALARSFGIQLNVKGDSVPWICILVEACSAHCSTAAALDRRLLVHGVSVRAERLLDCC